MPAFPWLRKKKMGCATSKEAHRDLQGDNAPDPRPSTPGPSSMARSITMPVHHPAEKEGDSCHVVALTSSTYGILKMDSAEESRRQSMGRSSSSRRSPFLNPSESIKFIGRSNSSCPFPYGLDNLRKSYDKAGLNGFSELKRYSNSKSLFEEEEVSETINTWELMEGLEDNPLTFARLGGKKPSPPQERRSYDRSFTCHSLKDVEQLVKDEPKASVCHKVTPGVKVDTSISSLRVFHEKKLTEKSSSSNSNTDTKPSWMLEPPSPSIFDPEYISEFRKALEQWTPRRNAVSPGVKVDTGICSLRLSPENKLTEKSSSPNSNTNTKPSWMLEPPSPSIFDPEYISEFRKALEECTPGSNAVSRSGSADEKKSSERSSVISKVSRGRSSSVKAKVKAFQQLIDVNSVKSRKKVSFASLGSSSCKISCPPRGENKVVLYFTTLRGIRKTYDDCQDLRLILGGLRIRVDERDISIDSGYKREFDELFGKGTKPPKLFVKGKYIGGIEEIEQMNEQGELREVFEGVATRSSFEPCECCGDDYRFIPCPNCDGSKKIFSEDGRWLRCPECNENGLVRCPMCC